LRRKIKSHKIFVLQLSVGLEGDAIQISRSSATRLFSQKFATVSFPQKSVTDIYFFDNL